MRNYGKYLVFKNPRQYSGGTRYYRVLCNRWEWQKVGKETKVFILYDPEVYNFQIGQWNKAIKKKTLYPDEVEWAKVKSKEWCPK